MLFIDNEGITDPRINLAIEEYALRQIPAGESYLLFYINEPRSSSAKIKIRWKKLIPN